MAELGIFEVEGTEREELEMKENSTVICIVENRSREVIEKIAQLPCSVRDISHAKLGRRFIVIHIHTFPFNPLQVCIALMNTAKTYELHLYLLQDSFTYSDTIDQISAMEPDEILLHDGSKVPWNIFIIN